MQYNFKISYDSLPSPLMSNPDLARLLKSDEIQKALRDPIKEKKKRVLKRNPLKNPKVSMDIFHLSILFINHI